MAIGLLAASFGKQSVSPDFGATKNGNGVSLWGRGIPSEVVTISIFAKDSEFAPIINDTRVPCSPRGDFATQFEVKSEVKGGLVAKMGWTDPKKVHHTMARAVE